MTIADWQQLSPAAAARAVLAGVNRLPPAQQHAAFAAVASEADLAAQFAGAPVGAPLRGVPYFLKDLFDVAGQSMLAGSTFLPEVRPVATRDSAIVTALRGAGAVLAGRAHLHEFAYGLTGENPHFGDCEHPGFPGRTSGGSSSGSAVAVAAGIAPFAIGTDTGGSIRVPAAFCGLYGIRLTPYDRWIVDGFPLAPSFDTAGWFTRTAADMLIMLGAVVGPATESGARRGCWVEPPGLDADVATVFRAAAGELAPPADAATRAALLSAFAPAAETYGVLGGREAWTLHADWADRYAARYDRVVRARLETARAVGPATIAAATAKATRLRETWAQFFAAHDFLVLPATPCAALTKADCTAANRARLLALTAPVSLAGWPALVRPLRLPSGLSTGLQVVVRDPGAGILRALLGAAASGDC